MKTFIADFIPKLERFSQQLDNLTLLIDKHWVIIDEIDVAKNVYIFRKNGQLLISHNGKVEKASWEYLGNNSILIDRNQDSYLFRHGFFDENILALKVDGKEEYAFMVNENRFEGEINSFDNVIIFLRTKYLDTSVEKAISPVRNVTNESKENKMISNERFVYYDSPQGRLQIENDIFKGSKVYINNLPAPTGKYKIGWMYYVNIKDGFISEITYT